MWTILRFELRSHEYGAAFDLLRRAGFVPHRRPEPGAAASLPAAVTGDLPQDPAVVSRAVFDVLEAAGLGPVAVAAAHVEVGRRARGGAALAPA